MSKCCPKIHYVKSSSLDGRTQCGLLQDRSYQWWERPRNHAVHTTRDRTKVTCKKCKV